MLALIVSKFAYSFAVVAVVVLMLLEQYVPDQFMVLLLACAGIAHVWLIRRAIRTIVDQESDAAINATLTLVSAAHRASHRPDEG